MTSSAAFLSCYACSAALPREASHCPACNAEQSELAAAHHHARAAARRSVLFWRQAAVVMGIVGFGFGIAFRGWMAGGLEQTTTAVTSERLPLTAVRDSWFRLMDSELTKQKAPLRLVSWVPYGDGGVMFEMAPPTKAQPHATWQALSTDGRTKMMAYLAVSYTTALIAQGHADALGESGHPLVAITYRGMSSPLAIRLPDGRVHVYRSPFDR